MHERTKSVPLHTCVRAHAHTHTHARTRTRVWWFPSTAGGGGTYGVGHTHNARTHPPDVEGGADTWRGARGESRQSNINAGFKAPTSACVCVYVWVSAEEHEFQFQCADPWLCVCVCVWVCVSMRGLNFWKTHACACTPLCVGMCEYAWIKILGNTRTRARTRACTRTRTHTRTHPLESQDQVIRAGDAVRCVRGQRR